MIRAAVRSPSTRPCCAECAAGPRKGIGDLWDVAVGAVGGSGIILAAIAAFVVYLAFFGPGANARKSALRQENERHSRAVADIKRNNRRLPSGAIW